MQFRLAVSAVDRGLDLNVKLVVARREEETMAHVVLRVLGYCLFYRAEVGESLRFTRGPADRDCPDLWAHDLAGTAIEWIICGDVEVDELRHVLQHQRQAKVRVLFGSAEERDRLAHGVRSLRRPPAGLGGVDFRRIDAALVEVLAARDLERQRWAVTFVEDHLYVDADGTTADCEVLREPLLDADAAAEGQPS